MNLIVTMIAPSQGGSGDYLVEIRREFTDFYPIHPVSPKTSFEALNKVLIEAQKIILRLFLYLIIPFIRPNKLFVYHPQTMGYWLTSLLIKKSSTIYYCIIDASIFCIKSYNFRRNKVCTHCIERIDPYTDCNFFPRKNNLRAFRNHRKTLNSNTDKIKFIVQTEGYKKIIKKIFGPSTSCSVIKMKFPSIRKIYPSNKEKKYDFIFHGNKIEAKGSKYVLELSKRLSNFSFFIPYHLNTEQKNLFTKSINWRSGLDKEISKSKIVLCPSIWSASVEGAILKSMRLKVPVAIHVNLFSASNTLIPKNCFIPLSGDLIKDIEILETIVKNNELLAVTSEAAFKWVNQYINV
jgi:hypothetical protein